MAKRIIEISVNDEYVVGSGVVIGAAGSDESVILRVAFGATWVGLNIYATFRDSKGESPTVELLMPSMLVPGEAMKYDVVVPATATAHAGKMSVVFSGFEITADNIYDAETGAYNKIVYRDAVINTTNAYFRVLPSDFSALDVKDEAEATVLEKVLSEINAFRGELDTHEDDVASAIGEHEAEIAATIGDLGMYEGENGQKESYTVAGRLDAQDVTIGERLHAQDTKLAEQDTKLAEQDTKLAAQDTKLAEQDTKLAAQDTKLAAQDEEIKRIAEKADSINNYDLTDADKEEIAQRVLSEYVDGNDIAYTGEEVSEDG